MIIIPLTLKAANQRIAAWHRHHGIFPPGLDYFRIGAVSDEGEIIGVAIVARPPNRNSDDGLTCEVVRLATNGDRNATMNRGRVCELRVGDSKSRAFVVGGKVIRPKAEPSKHEITT